MRLSSMIWVVTGILVMAAITVGILLFVPASSRVESTASQADAVRQRLDAVESAAVGDTFIRELGLFITGRREKAAEIDLACAHLAARLDTRFPEMKVPEGAEWPAPDEFQRAYNYNGDQVRVRVRDFVSRAGGPVARETPLMVPPFASTVTDEAAMRKWQRFANVEAIILTAAAKTGAPPESAMRIASEPAPPDDQDPDFERLRIGVDFWCPEGRASVVAHAVLSSFDEFGCVMSLVGMTETPVDEARLRQQPETPVKRLSLTCILGFPALKGEAR